MTYLHTAPIAQYVPTPGPTPLSEQVGRMDQHEKMRLRAAAHHARKVYPGPVGKLLAREILTWEEFGYRLDGDGLMMQSVRDILATPVPITP